MTLCLGGHMLVLEGCMPGLFQMFSDTDGYCHPAAILLEKLFQLKMDLYYSWIFHAPHWPADLRQAYYLATNRTEQVRLAGLAVERFIAECGIQPEPQPEKETTNESTYAESR
jgi:hypothetical protein